MAPVHITLVATFVAIISIASSIPVNTDVAFSVGLTNTQRMNDKDIVMYDRVFVNHHYAFNTMTGKFRCPIAGTYIFHFHAYNTNKDSIMWLELMHNNNPTVSVSGYNAHTVGSQSIILPLRQGDTVHVQSKEQQVFALFGLPDQIYSTFSGHLISTATSNPLMDSGNNLIG